MNTFSAAAGGRAAAAGAKAVSATGAAISASSASVRTAAGRARARLLRGTAWPSCTTCTALCRVPHDLSVSTVRFLASNAPFQDAIGHDPAAPAQLHGVKVNQAPDQHEGRTLMYHPYSCLQPGTAFGFGDRQQEWRCKNQCCHPAAEHLGSLRSRHRRRGEGCLLGLRDAAQRRRVHVRRVPDGSCFPMPSEDIKHLSRCITLWRPDGSGQQE